MSPSASSVVAREVDVPGLAGPVLVQGPESPRLAVVGLHGAAAPERDQPLFAHLGRTLGPLGIAVLTYDRRPSVDGDDVPLAEQAEDAVHAAAAASAAFDVPVGLFGFSQGAWAACAAADRLPEPASLVLVGYSGVSPAEQMRHHTDELLRRAGYPAGDRRELASLRLALEDVLRGSGDRDHSARLLEAAVQRPWFPLAYLPPELPPEGVRWRDQDLDPATLGRGLGCPTLLVHGADDDSVPIERSIAVRREAGPGEVTSVVLPGTGHLPVVAGRDPVTTEDFAPGYTAALQAFYRG